MFHYALTFDENVCTKCFTKTRWLRIGDSEEENCSIRCRPGCNINIYTINNNNIIGYGGKFKQVSISIRRCTTAIKSTRNELETHVRAGFKLSLLLLLFIITIDTGNRLAFQMIITPTE